MKLIKLFGSTALASALVIALAGCQHLPPQTTPIPGPGGNPGDAGLGSGRPLNSGADTGSQTGTPLTGEYHPPTGPGAHQGFSEDTSALQADILYFDYDKSTVKPSEQSKLDAVASYLKSNADKALRVEGNCDERGTEEYNRSLGERRALAAREYLIQSGIAPDRIDTLTNGQDKPAVQGHNEEAWSKNRRDEFIVLSPPGRAL